MVIDLAQIPIVGVEEMDKDHRRLVELLNNVYVLLKDNRKDEAMRTFKTELLAFVEHHLAREEAFMASIGYPELERHKKAHENFRKVVLDLMPHVENGDESAFREALALAWGWLAGHIAKVDIKYGEYAKEKGLIV